MEIELALIKSTMRKIHNSKMRNVNSPYLDTENMRMVDNWVKSEYATSVSKHRSLGTAVCDRLDRKQDKEESWDDEVYEMTKQFIQELGV